MNRLPSWSFFDMPDERTKSLDASRDYSGPNAHTLRNGYTLETAARPGSQASVANAAIVRNAKPGAVFTAADVFRWQKKEAGKGRSLETLPAHLESLVGKGFIIAVSNSSYRLA